MDKTTCLWTLTWRERDHRSSHQPYQPHHLHPLHHPHQENLGNERESPMTSPTMRTTRVDGGGLAFGSNWQQWQKKLQRGLPQRLLLLMRLSWQWSQGVRIGRHLEVGFQVDGGVDGGLLHQIVDVEVVVPEK